MSDATKVTVEFSEEQMVVINELLDANKCSNLEDLIRRGLSMLQYLNEQKKVGRIIASMDEANKTYREIDWA